ncbi:MAG: phytanoyl-CoA dioxygenase family protein [Inquilinaceae bacterium]
MNHQSSTSRDVWISDRSCSLDAFADILSAQRDRVATPHAAAVDKNIPIYDAAWIRARIDDDAAIAGLMAEWTNVLMDGAGVLAVKNAIADHQIVDDATGILNGIIEAERTTNKGGDHFAKAGSNSRVWNAHEKLCMASPEVFARYNANDIVPLVSRAWLGPLYQITTQVNVVRPGGEAQNPHRDYHMGFQPVAQLERYPAHTHRLSAMLTLQGAIAHCDMPVDSGPTMVLPFSQRYLPGYIAAHRPEFSAYFAEHHVQLPLGKGDMLFFNPALFHAAGTNRTTDVVRFANLMQIGSGYGRSIEIVDRARMSAALYPVVRDMKRDNVLTAREIDNVIAACAEGYPFPANLDIDSPLTGMAPPSQQDFFRMALAEDWETERFRKTMDDYTARRVSH